MQKVIKNKIDRVLIIGILLSIGICNTGIAAGSSMSILPAVITEESLGNIFIIDVNVNPAGSEIFGAQYDLLYDKNVLKATDQNKGSLLSQDGANSAEVVNSIDNSNGKIQYGEIRTGDPDVIGGMLDSGTLASITFEVIGSGASNLVLEAKLSDPLAQLIDVETNNGLYGESDNWREEWMGEDSDGGTAVTTSELQDAIHYWLDDIMVRGHLLSTGDLQEVIATWLSG